MSVPRQKLEPAGVLPVEVVNTMDRYTFLEHYRFRKPFVLRGGASHVPAFRRWTLEYLESRIADITINPLMYDEDRRDYSRASFVEMKRAVDGCAARMSSTSSPSLIPPASMRWPRTVLAPAACRRGSNLNVARKRGFSIVHPVNARATSVTSLCE